MLGPLRDSLTRVERQVGVLERDRVEQYARLDEQLIAVAASGEALRGQTAALVGALRSSNTRGTWGEAQLRRVVEHAGMLARVDFVEQASAASAGRRRRAARPGGPAARRQAAGGRRQGTADRVPGRRRLRGRRPSGAGCWPRTPRRCAGTSTCWPPAPTGRPSPRPPRWSSASCPATRSWRPRWTPTRRCTRPPWPAGWCSPHPATLLALLRTVAFTWQQDALSGNARELFEVGKELYARLGTLGEPLGQAGPHAAPRGRGLQRAGRHAGAPGAGHRPADERPRPDRRRPAGRCRPSRRRRER